MMLGLTGKSNGIYDVYKFKLLKHSAHYFPFRKCFIQLRLLLVAVAISPPGDRSMPRVVLNPSGRGQHATIIDADMKGFFICQSDDEVKRVAFFCNKCHENVPVLKITQCSCYDKSMQFTYIIPLCTWSYCHDRRNCQLMFSCMTNMRTGRYSVFSGSHSD
jgi:hypothetical protein